MGNKPITIEESAKNIASTYFNVEFNEKCPTTKVIVPIWNGFNELYTVRKYHPDEVPMFPVMKDEPLSGTELTEKELQYNFFTKPITPMTYENVSVTPSIHAIVTDSEPVNVNTDEPYSFGVDDELLKVSTQDLD